MDKNRIGDQKEKFLVARMTERQKKIAQFKAHKMTQSVDNLVIAAVDLLDIHQSIQGLTCSSCGAEKSNSRQPFLYQYNEDIEVQVVNYPKSNCDCKDDKSEFYAENYLEDLIEFEIQQCLEENQEVPKEIDLNQLLKMD